MFLKKKRDAFFFLDVYVIGCSVETEPHYVAQPVLEISDPLPLPHEWWD